MGAPWKVYVAGARCGLFPHMGAFARWPRNGEGSGVMLGSLYSDSPDHYASCPLELKTLPFKLTCEFSGHPSKHTCL
jgi:hypothetical protein